MKIFVPGRICLFGEHSDWAGAYRRLNPEIEKGFTLISGTNQGVYAEVEPHPDALVLTAASPDGQVQGPYQIPMQADSLLAEAQLGGFWSYIAGVAYQALIHYQVRGLVINNYQTDLPIQKGLSSSAAICVLAARAFNRLYELKLTVRGEMELAYQGEITTPSQCGRMDQGCAFGSRPVLMTFDGDRLETEEIRPKHELYFVLVDLQAKKNTKKILAQLNRCFPHAENEVAQGVQTLLGPENRRIVQRAVDAVRASDAQRLGALMNEAQELFDRYAMPACPDELTAPILHRVLNYSAVQTHIWGGKGVGSQGDGTAQLIARSAADQQSTIEIIERDLGMKCHPLTLHSGMRVRKALIPAAGFGTRLFPATKAVKKEFFPIVDRDGVTKPAILILVEEALQAGIEEVYIIVQPADLADFQDFFNQQISLENFNKLSRDFQQYAQKLLDMGQHVRFISQPFQEGFGHAVYCAREKIGEEPFILYLGDHLYRSNQEKSCTQQLLAAFDHHGSSLVGLRRTPEALINKFGTVAGAWLEPERVLNITEFAEKPELEYAQQKLRVPELPEHEYLTLFGLYIIQPQVFHYLEEHIQNNVRERGEFQLTSALDRLRREQGFLGLLVDGVRYDIGVPEHYVETVSKFRER